MAGEGVGAWGLLERSGGGDASRLDRDGERKETAQDWIGATPDEIMGIRVELWVVKWASLRKFCHRA